MCDGERIFFSSQNSLVLKKYAIAVIYDKTNLKGALTKSAVVEIFPNQYLTYKQYQNSKGRGGVKRRAPFLQKYKNVEE